MRLALLAVLALGQPALAAMPAPETTHELAGRPSDALLRFQVAEALSKSTNHAEEARIALESMLGDPAVGPSARKALVSLCVRQPSKAGWIGTYETLLAGPTPGEAERARLQLRLAAAKVQIPALRTTGMTELERIIEVLPNDVEARLALSDAALVEGAADRALAALVPVMSDNSIARERALAGLASRALANAALADLSYPTASENPVLDQRINAALKDPSPLNRARALREAGYLDMAAAVLRNTDGTPPADPDSLVTLCDILVQLDRVRDATILLKALTTTQPNDPESLLALARTLWASGQPEKALAALPNVQSPGAQALLAQHLLVTARKSRDPSDDATAITRAYELAPSEPDIALAQARQWRNTGSNDPRVVDALRTTLTARPLDKEALELWTRTAADNGVDPLPELHAALAAAPANRAEELRGRLVLAHVLLAERAKNARKAQTAEEHYAMATLINPQDSGVLAGLGGLKWQLGQTEDARRAYLAAYRQNPKDGGVSRALVGLALTEGDLPEARRWMALVPDRNSSETRHLKMRLELETNLVDARQARKKKEYSRSLELYSGVRASHPSATWVLYEVGDTQLEAGKASDALDTYQQVARIEPGSQWASVGEANALVALGRVPEAKDRLGSVVGVEDPELARQVSRVRARVHRAQGDALRETGDNEGAMNQYLAALELAPDTWSLTSIGWLYLAQRQTVSALDVFNEAVLADPSNQVARRGHVFALASSGALESALTEARALAEDHPSSENIQLSSDVRYQSDHRQALLARAEGNYDAARELLEDLNTRRPDDPNIIAALGAVRLDQGRAAGAMDLAERALDADPDNGLAIATLLSSADSLGAPEKIQPILERAVTNGGGAPARLGLDRARLRLTLHSAETLAAERDRSGASSMLEAAERTAAGRPDELAMIGGSYLKIREATEALRVFEAGLDVDDRHAGAILGKAGTLRAMGRNREADQWLQDSFDVDRDPTVGLEYAKVLAEQGRKRKARAVLDDVITNGRSQSAHSGLQAKPLPLITLPSGRKVEGSAGSALEAPDGPDAEMKARAEGIRRSLDRSQAPILSVSPMVLARPGVQGRNFLSATMIHGGLHDLRLGTFRVSAEVLLVNLFDGEKSQQGAGFSGGFSTAPRLPWGVSGHVGLSPSGFSGDPYLTWFGQVRGRVGQTYLGVESGRSPVNDSLMSWAGTPSSSGLVSGRVVRTWFGGYIAAPQGPNTEVSVAARGGWLDVRGRAPVNYVDGSVSAMTVINQGRPYLRAGAQGIVNAYADQIGGFEYGEAGAFTPQLFLAGMARVEGGADFSDERVWTGFQAGFGPQLLVGEDTIYFGSGAKVAADANASVAALVGSRTRLSLAVRWQTTVPEWFQTSVMARIEFVPQGSKARPERNATFSPTFGDGVVTSQGAHPR
ncbi:MAG: tetratricopeptide repeat protein [Myxococcota bacterium]